jgi:hypothetical protein
MTRAFMHAVFCLESRPQPPHSYREAVSKKNLNSTRYSNLKPIPCCVSPPLRIGSSGVPPLGIWSYSVALSRRIESYGVAPTGDPILQCVPPGRSDPSVWLPPRGINTTPLDSSNILWEPAAAFIEIIYEKWLYGRTVPRPIRGNIQARDLL